MKWEKKSYIRHEVYQVVYLILLYLSELLILQVKASMDECGELSA